MAKQFGKNPTVDFAPANLMSFGKSFSTLNGQPLVKSEVWYDKAALDAFAASDAAYVGQRVVFVDTENNKVFNYSIQIDGTLKEIGSSVIGDEKTISVAEDGTISLVGVNGLELERETDGGTTKITYQPLLVDGKLTWVEPSATTVEGLQSLIEALRADVDDINAKIGEVETGKTVIQIIEEAKAAATYDDTAIVGRLKVIEDDYLKNSDKTALETAISTAKKEAIEEAVLKVVGEGTSEDFDTLKEVADWILSDTTGAAALITRVTNIESDYLKSSDKTALQNSISEVRTLIGEIPEDATSSTVVEYIKEVVDALEIGNYAKAAELAAIAERVSTLENVGAEKNIINAVDEAEFDIDDERKLTVKAISMDKVTGLPEALEKKVNAQDGYRLISNAEAEKLEKLVLGEDGSVSVSGTIAAGNVSGLADWITTRAGTLKGLSENNLTDELKDKIEKSQENVIEIVKVGGSAVSIDPETKSVNIPIATAAALGVVKSSNAENGIKVSEDGTMSVNSVNINNLVQTDGDVIVLDGGNSERD